MCTYSMYIGTHSGSCRWTGLDGLGWARWGDLMSGSPSVDMAYPPLLTSHHTGDVSLLGPYLLHCLSAVHSQMSPDQHASQQASSTLSNIRVSAGLIQPEAAQTWPDAFTRTRTVLRHHPVQASLLVTLSVSHLSSCP